MHKKLEFAFKRILLLGINFACLTYLLSIRVEIDYHGKIGSNCVCILQNQIFSDNVFCAILVTCYIVNNTVVQPVVIFHLWKCCFVLILLNLIDWELKLSTCREFVCGKIAVDCPPPPPSLALFSGKETWGSRLCINQWNWLLGNLNNFKISPSQNYSCLCGLLYQWVI